MSLEAFTYSKETQDNPKEKVDRKQYNKIQETKDKINGWVDKYLSEDPTGYSDSDNNFGKPSIKGAIKESREAANGVGLEKTPGFTRKYGDLLEKVEYRDGQITSNIIFHNEVLTVTISDFQKNPEGDRKNEKPVDVKISGNMSSENRKILFKELNIGKHLSESDLGLAITEKLIDDRKQETHGYLAKKQQEKEVQKGKTIDLEYFLKILGMDKGPSDSMSDMLKSNIKSELGYENPHSLDELKLCAALVILGRSMSSQEILNKFDTENKTGDEIGGVSTLTQDEDILEYIANNPGYFAGYFVRYADEIISEATNLLSGQPDDEFKQILQYK